MCHITQALLLGRKSFLSNVCKISVGFLFPQSLFYDLFRAFCQFDISWQKYKNILMPAKTLQISLVDNTKNHTSIKIYTLTYSPLILEHVWFSSDHSQGILHQTSVYKTQMISQE